MAPHHVATERGYGSRLHTQSPASARADPTARTVAGHRIGGSTSRQELCIQVTFKAVVHGAYASRGNSQKAISRIATPWTPTSVPRRRHQPRVATSSSVETSPAHSNG